MSLQRDKGDQGEGIQREERDQERRSKERDKERSKEGRREAKEEGERQREKGDKDGIREGSIPSRKGYDKEGIRRENKREGRTG